jgi:uncharacterized protein YcsI (UPF0317 family)
MFFRSNTDPASLVEMSSNDLRRVVRKGIVARDQTAGLALAEEALAIIVARHREVSNDYARGGRRNPPPQPVVNGNPNQNQGNNHQHNHVRRN